MNENLVIDLLKYKKSKQQQKAVLGNPSSFSPQKIFENKSPMQIDLQISVRNEELKRKLISSKLEKLINKIKNSITNLEQKLNNQNKI